MQGKISALLQDCKNCLSVSNWQVKKSELKEELELPEQQCTSAWVWLNYKTSTLRPKILQNLHLYKIEKKVSLRKTFQASTISPYEFTNLLYRLRIYYTDYEFTILTMNLLYRLWIYYTDYEFTM